MVETITIHLGKSTTVSLKSLATAGYSWQFETDNAGIISVEQIENKNDVGRMPMGASLDEIFKIYGMSVGISELSFHQRRIWETKDPPVQKKTYQIRVVE